MVTLEDKIDLFKKMVLLRTEKDVQNRLESVQKKQEEELEVYTQDVLQRKENFIAKMEQKARDEKRKMLSRAKSESKHKVLSTRHKMIDELIDAVKERIHGFAESEIYTMFLKDNLKRNLEKFHEFDTVIVELTQQDHHMYGDMIATSLKRAGYSSKQVKLVSTKEDIIGGFIIYDGDKTVRIDFSLLAVIADNRRYIGRLVYEVLSEAGEENGRTGHHKNG